MTCNLIFQYFICDNISQYVILINCDSCTFVTTHAENAAAQIRLCFEWISSLTKVWRNCFYHYPQVLYFFCQTSSCLLLCFRHRLFLSCCTYKVTRSYNSREPQLKILITFWKLKKWCTSVYYRSTLSTFHLYEGYSYRCDTTNNVCPGYKP